MEKNEIIGKLSSYFGLTGTEAEYFYNKIFNKGPENTSFTDRTSIEEKFEPQKVYVYENPPEEQNVQPEEQTVQPVEPPAVIQEETSIKQKEETASTDKIEPEIPVIDISSISAFRKTEPPALVKTSSMIEVETKPIEKEEITQPPVIKAPEPLQENITPEPEETAPLPYESPQFHQSDSSASGDNSSYYIWYKDAASNETETENMSYEYELMYQAAKETQYPSKMKIYAASFVFFFSFVLIVLILSPVIYKEYFATEDVKSTEEKTINPENKQESNFYKKAYPSLSHDITDDNVLRGEQKEPGDKTEKTIPQKKEESVVTSGGQTDLKKTPNGWEDKKYNVIYVELDNGKYTIQESSWDSSEKAEKRVEEIESLGIPGITGSIDVTSINDKGKWYRVRFGEFSTIDEARKKVEQFLKL